MEFISSKKKKEVCLFCCLSISSGLFLPLAVKVPSLGQSTLREQEEIFLEIQPDLENAVGLPVSLSRI